MKQLTIEFSTGMKTSLMFNGEITAIYVGHKEMKVDEAIKQLESTQESLDLFTGLWFTDKGMFVEVIANKEAYILSEDGTRFMNTKVDANGISEDAGRLNFKRRGDETKVNGTDLTWPSPKGNRLF